MKIIQLTAENIKKLVAVEIRPDGAMVQITGKNGQGKTSVLDSIWWALSGAKHIQAAPIRKGANQARIRIDMGEIIVTRTFKREGEDGFTTKLEVVGNIKGSPQAMLDSLLDSLAFDPLKFARMESKEQFDALKRFAPDVDFDKIAAANSIDMANRKEINRKAKEEAIVADQIVIPLNAPKGLIDEGALIKKLSEAGRTNADLQLQAERRKRDGEDVEKALRQAEALQERARELHVQAKEATQRAKSLESAALENKAALDKSAPLPAPVNTSALERQIEDARRSNSIVGAIERKRTLEKNVKELEKKAEVLTQQMKDREEQKQGAIAKAKLPVESITFGEGVVLLNGVPFNQGSDAEQLRASCMLAMSGNPHLRVIRVRDGSLMDGDSLALLAKIAEERDFQVWVERASNGEAVGFVLEDGSIRHDAEEQGKLL